MAAPTSDAVTTVSEETRRQLVHLYPWLAAKLTVVSNPVTVDFGQAQPRTPHSIPDLTHVTVLVIGTGANKNLLTTAAAVSEIGASLRIIGQLDEATAAALREVKVRYTAAHSLAQNELVDEYYDADVLVFASLHEGFGLPILDRESVGLPVVTSDRSPMREVAGGASLLVDPTSVSEIAVAIATIAADEQLRTRLAQNGTENVRRYAAPQVAESYGCVYRQLLAPDFDHLG